MAPPPRSALVTGAASGIGAAVARRLAVAGYDVIRLDRAHVEADGVGRSVTIDLTDSEAVEQLVRSDDLPDTLDVLVCCAGVYEPTPVKGWRSDRYRHVLETNLSATLDLTAALAPRISAGRSPRILLTSSIQSRYGEMASLAYGVSKAGLAQAARVLAVELGADGVLVNALAPGFIETPMARLADGRSEHETDEFVTVYVEHARIPLRRPGTAEEVAEVAAFLVSPTNTYLTGQVIAVDGGLTATF